MAKLLFEYNNKPCIFESTLNKIDKTSFIVVYETDNLVFEKRVVTTLKEAIEFNAESNRRKVIFLQLEEFQENSTYVEYATVSCWKELFIQKAFEFSPKKDTKISIEFGLDSFDIVKTSLKPLGNWHAYTEDYNIWFSRREGKSVNGNTVYELRDSFYEFIPRYEDMFMEAAFVYDIMLGAPITDDSKVIEAYLLQGKQKAEKSIPPVQYNTSIQKKEEAITLIESTALDTLIGLEKVKLEIQELKALASLRKKRLEMGLPVTPNTLHLIFTGNPGTGKTTVARLLGKIYYELGLLKTSTVIEVTRTDLIAEYVGQTAPKTKKVFEKALGGILFIDEAYSLVKGGNDFGAEAIETLLKLMEDHREEVVVIIAGYPNEIEGLLMSNPGLKSRFSKTIHFDDYKKEELFQIFTKLVTDYRNKLSDGAKFKLEYLIEEYYDTGYFNSNARSIRNIFEEATKRQAKRLSKIKNPSTEEMVTFLDKDLVDALD